MPPAAPKSAPVYEAKLSKDGHSYTPGKGTAGLQGGLKTYGVIEPAECVKNPDQVWDCIVVGAGYTGLIAARDLVKAGVKTLLLEARDRVGGRTWSAEVDGTTYEMGGTWVSHVHGRLFGEMMRYGLKDEVTMTRTQGGGAEYFTLDTGSGSRRFSLKEAADMTTRAWRIFINVDGDDGRTICPLPYSSLENSRVKRADVTAIDQLSCQDRIDQIADQLSADEKALIESLVPHCSGGTTANTAFLEFLRSQALQGYTPETFEEVWTLYKIKGGQSNLARRIFDDAARLGLQYAFKVPVASFVDAEGIVTLGTKAGRKFKAKRVINTLPVAVLPTVKFDPPLSALRKEAIAVGQVNYLTKVHAKAEGDLRGLRGCCWPGDLLYVYGDGWCADGKSTRLTSFAGDNRKTLNPLQEPERLVTAFKRFHPMDIKQLYFHDWISDPYSLAGPAWYSAGFLSKFLDELQSRHGNVLMANSDWASGWRAFIEGAMEQGALAADTVMEEVGVRGAHFA